MPELFTVLSPNDALNKLFAHLPLHAAIETIDTADGLNRVLAETPIAHEPLPALSITFWDDNQFALVLNGSLSVEYHNPSADQYFDIDSVEIYQQQ